MSCRRIRSAKIVMRSQNHTTKMKIVRTSAKKLEKLKPPSKSISTLHVLQENFTCPGAHATSSAGRRMLRNANGCVERQLLDLGPTCARLLSISPVVTTGQVPLSCSKHCGVGGAKGETHQGGASGAAAG